MPVIYSIQDFEDKWIQWWSAIQPQWRDTGNWPFAREDAAGQDWGHLLKGGKDGLFLVVISLGWWIHACDLSKSKAYDAIMDVAWVMKSLVTRLSADVTTSNPPATPSTTPREKRAGPVNTSRPLKRLRS